jgi:antitoxin component YwqK of YwqJK toxin-antitoxin module
MSTTMLFAILLYSWTAPALFSMGWAADKPQLHRKTLDQPTEIQGYPCAKGYAWFFADGKLLNCTVSRAIAFGEATIPAGSWITLSPEGKPRIAQMKQDTNVAGVTCMGGSWLGPSEGAMTAFYPSGKLEQCFLAGDQTVQGVPCMNGGIFDDGIGSGAMFYANGKLKSCKLTKDFGTWKRGNRFVQGP